MNEPEGAFIETPIGPAAIRYQTNPFRLTAVDLSGPAKPPKQSKTCQPEIDALQQICRLIREYFNGRPISPPWQRLAMTHLTELQRKVLYETAKIPYGSLKTYKQIAEAIGRPRAYRFVGSALGRNPFPLIVPCHRVIRNDGNIGNFGAGPAIKQWLIEFESGKPQGLQLDVRHAKD